MPLQLNLLHEEFTEERQRKRDPLKLGMMALGAVGALMLVFYGFRAYQTLAIKNRLGAIEEEWAKVEPKVTAAQKRAAELNDIINTTKVLDSMIESRFFWAPLLQKLSGCVAPNTQLTNFDGTINVNKTVTLTIEGKATGAEPRAAAEEFRQLLSEELGKKYRNVRAEFKILEDLDTAVDVGGTSLPVARYIITVGLAPQPDSETNNSTRSDQALAKK
ncbi:MAG TPA: hypothetical protein VH207_00750 [Chthoniobacterales bacterium]|jgi:hypothetical protein|nr:hypothetical protein [Chthoniobacterales bacterium]